MNVFAVEWRDEGLIELGQDGMSQLIADALDAPDFRDLAVEVGIVRENVDHGPSTGDQVLGHLGEHVEKGIVPRDEWSHRGQGLPNSVSAAERRTISCGPTDSQIEWRSGA